MLTFLLPLITWSFRSEAVHDRVCGFCLLLTLAQNSGVRNWEQTSSLTTEMTHSTFCKYSDQVHLQRLRDSPLESRHTHISISLFKSPYMPTTAFDLQGNRRRQSPRLLYSFPSRHSAPSQSWQFNDFTSFLWKPRCMVGNDRFEVQQESYIIEALTGPAWIISPSLLATALLAGRSLSFRAQETEFQPSGPFWILEL